MLSGTCQEVRASSAGEMRKGIRAYMTRVLARGPAVGPITTHDSGYIQVPVGEYAMVQVWPDTLLVKREPPLLIRAFPFTFRSWVLLGALDHAQFDCQVSVTDFGMTHEIYALEHSGPRPTDFHCFPRLRSRHRMAAGSIFEVKPGVFHEIAWDRLSVSLSIRSGKGSGAVEALCPHQVCPDSMFDGTRANPQEHLDSIVNQACQAVLGALEETWAG